MSLLNTIFANKSAEPTTTTVDPNVPIPQAPTQPADPNLPGQMTAVSQTPSPLQQQDITALSHLDERSTQVIAQAYNEAKRLHQTFIEADELLLSLFTDKGIYDLLEQFSVDMATLTRNIQAKQVQGTFAGEPTLSEDTKQILEGAYTAAKARQVDFIKPEDILLSMFDRSQAIASTLSAQGLDKAKIQSKLTSSTEYQTGKKSRIEEYGIDLTQKARDGKIDPITGRDTEIQRLIHILLRRTKNNPIIIGEAGVGKTAIVEGLAQMIVDGKSVPDLADKKIIQLDVSSLIAGASHRGEFEQRLQDVIKEAMASDGKIILFIDEIHTLIGAGDSGGALDASNIIKPYLSRGQIQIIGTTTTSEYRRYFEKDRAFERRFQAIMCDEPSEESALEMIKILLPKYEKFHKLTFAPDALVAAVHLSKRYIGERFLPDKAIDLLDEAASEVRLDHNSGKRQDNMVQVTDIQNVVSRWTGIPITKLTEKESDKLLHLEELIHKTFINHDRAVSAVAEAVRRGRIGLANANRPIASFIFLGPTGTGKTELAKVLAEIMFGRKDSMIRLDMSEYMEKHEVAKLVGAPPGYVGYEEGGQLTEAVRAKPYSIVLLDEIEKAHPDVFNILLQLLEDGRLTDNKGNTVSFKNTVIIATSNIGSSLIRDYIQNPDAVVTPGSMTDMMKMDQSGNPLPADKTEVPANPAVAAKSGQAPAPDYSKLQKIVMSELSKFFKPELLNRFDEIVSFEPLTAENMMEIAKLGIESTRKMLKEQQIDLQVSANALAQLAKEGYDPAYGARPLRRLIQRSIENPVAIYLIKRALAPGDTVLIDYMPKEDRFTFTKAAGAPQTPATVGATPGVPPAPATPSMGLPQLDGNTGATPVPTDPTASTVAPAQPVATTPVPVAPNDFTPVPPVEEKIVS